MSLIKDYMLVNKRPILITIVYCIIFPITPPMVKVWGYTPSIFTIIYLGALIYLVYTYILAIIKKVRNENSAKKVFIEFLLIISLFVLSWLGGAWLMQNIY